MFTYRPTARLAKRLGTQPVPEHYPTTTRLGDWYGNLLRHGPHQMILCTSDKSRLSVVLPAKDAKHSLPVALPMGVGALLAAIGVRHVLIQAELDAMREAVIGKPISRSVLGSMNDFAFGIMCRLDDDPRAPFHELALELAETPCSPLGYDSPLKTARHLLS